MRLALVGWVASIGAHATGGVLALWTLQQASVPGLVHLPRPTEPRHSAVVLPPPPGRPSLQAPDAPALRPAPKPFTARRGDRVIEPVPPAGSDSGRRPAMISAAAEPPHAGRIGPRYASGTLWVRAQGTISVEPTVAKSHAELVDSVVRAAVGSYVDSMRLEAARRLREGHWGNKDFGIDSKWITVGGVRIPSAVLGLLPVNLPAPSIDQVKAAERLAGMRADIHRAAATAHDDGDFKRTVQDIRERTDAAREFERSSRLPMPPLPVDTAAP